MHILLSTFGSRGDVQPLAALAAALRTLGAEAVVVAPPDQGNAELLARAGASFVPAFTSVRTWLEEAPKRKAALPELAAEIMAATFETIGAVAQGCDAIVATGLFPSTAAAQSVAEKLGLGYTYGAYCPAFLPSLHHRPFAFPGHPHPPAVTDNAVLWELNAKAMEAIFGPAWNANRATIGLAPACGVRDRVFTGRPLLAADPILAPWQPGDLTDVIQTGAWILPDARPLPPDLVAFLESGSPPVTVGYGSMPMAAAPGAARVAVEAVRAQRRRVILSRGWAELAAIDERDDCFVVGEVNQQALFGRVAAVVHHGGAGTTTIATQAGAPQVVVPQFGDQPYWAGRVAALGIGVAHDGATPTAGSLSHALEAVLVPQVRLRATEVAGQTRPDGAMVAARLILDGLLLPSP